MFETMIDNQTENGGKVTFACSKCWLQTVVDSNDDIPIQIDGICDRCWPTIEHDVASQKRRAKDLGMLLDSLDHRTEIKTAISGEFADIVATLGVRDFEAGIGTSIDPNLGRLDDTIDEWQELYDRFFDKHWSAFERFIVSRVEATDRITALISAHAAHMAIVSAGLDTLLTEPLEAYETVKAGETVFHRRDLLCRADFSPENLSRGYSVGTIVVDPNEMVKARARLRELLLAGQAQLLSLDC